jgi:hypothetical protein
MEAGGGKNVGVGFLFECVCSSEANFLRVHNSPTVREVHQPAILKWEIYKDDIVSTSLPRRSGSGCHSEERGPGASHNSGKRKEKNMLTETPTNFKRINHAAKTHDNLMV